MYSSVLQGGPGKLRRPVRRSERGTQTLHLTALLRKSDSFRSPKSRKLDPGNSLSAGKGSKTASIAAGSGDPLRLGFPYSRAAARLAQSSCLSSGKRAGAGPGRSPEGGAGGGGTTPGRGRRGREGLRAEARSGLGSGAPAHRGHLADSSSSCSSGGTAGFHGEPGSGAEGLRSPRDRVGARDGGAESSPETGWLPGAPLSQRPLCSASVTFLCETGNPGLVSPAGRGATPPHQYSR